MGNGGDGLQRRSAEDLPTVRPDGTVAETLPSSKEGRKPPVEHRQKDCLAKNTVPYFQPHHKENTSSHSAGDRLSTANRCSAASPDDPLKHPLEELCDEKPMTRSSALPTALELGLDPALLKFLISEADIEEDNIVNELINSDWMKSHRSSRKDSSDAQAKSPSSEPTVDDEVPEDSIQHSHGSALSDDAKEFAARVRTTTLPRDVQRYMILLRAVPDLWRYNGKVDGEQDDEEK